jgi:hypothetical protein
MVLIILQYGITHGTELTIVASAFMYSGNLLRRSSRRALATQPRGYSTWCYFYHVFSRQSVNSLKVDDTQCLDMAITANEPV